MVDPTGNTLNEVTQSEMRKHGLQETADYSSLELKRCSIGPTESGGAKHDIVTVAHQKFENFLFEDFAARGVVFDDCDFSYSVFTRAYFYRATFKNCVFIGCRFIDCNFRSAKISESDFSYASFRGTIVPSKELVSNSPIRPNVRRELMRALRVNATSIGDDDGVKFFIREELKAGEEHNRRAREAREPYYAAKYGWDENKWNWLKVRAEWLWLSMQRFGWGYGEYPLNLLRTTAILLVIFAALPLLKGCSPNQSFASRLFSNFGHTISVFLGTPLAAQQIEPSMGWWWISSIVLLRFLALSLFVAMLFRRLSRR